MSITQPINRSTATPEQIAAEAKAKLAILKKYESFDLEAKQAKIADHRLAMEKLQGEIDAYLDFLGIPKEEPKQEPVARISRKPREKAAGALLDPSDAVIPVEAKALEAAK